MPQEILVKQVSEQIEFQDAEIIERLSGIGHENLKVVSDALGVQIGARGETLTLKGPLRQVKLATKLFIQFGRLAEKHEREFGPEDMKKAVALLKDSPHAKLHALFSDNLFQTPKGKQIVPSGPGQKAYTDAIRTHDMVFGVGPAGTGKTYLAMTMAVAALDSGEVARLILSRPAVEAGEKLGFLPGTMEEKVLPYLRPLYDAMYELLGRDRAEELVENGTIEVAPLAFMRGRTLNDAFVILDEAQNTTPEQMKMLITRLGFGSKMVINGDITQVDLPDNMESGLVVALEILKGVPGISICELTAKDVVRHKLVQEIVKAYESFKEK